MDQFTNSDFISRGLPFPPVKSKKRLGEYDKHSKQYAGDRKDVITIKTTFASKDVPGPIFNVNFYKLITDKLVSLLTTEKPYIHTNLEDSNIILTHIVNSTNYIKLIEQLAKTILIYGDGYLYLDFRTKKINVVNPQYVYKVVDAQNIKSVKNYVLASVVYIPNYDTGIDEPRYLRVEKHYKGYFTVNYFDYSGGSLGSAATVGKCKANNKTKIYTGLDDFAIIPAVWNETVNRVYGQSDFSIIEACVEEIEKRQTLISQILDKYSEPVVETSKSHIQKNEITGEATIDLFGNILFKKNGENTSTNILTWDGNIAQHIQFIDLLESEISTLSEFGRTFLFGEVGSNISGETLKLSATSLLAKSSRLIDAIDYPLRKGLQLLLKLYDRDVVISDVLIDWNDGLPSSESLIIQNGLSLINAGVLSKKHFIKDLKNLTDEQAELLFEEINQEQQEQAVQMAQLNTPVPPFSNIEEVINTEETLAGVNEKEESQYGTERIDE